MPASSKLWEASSALREEVQKLVDTNETLAAKVVELENKLRVKTAGLAPDLEKEVKRLNDIITHKNQDFAAMCRQSEDWERQAHKTQNELDEARRGLSDIHKEVYGYAPGTGESVGTVVGRCARRVKEMKDEAMTPLPPPDFVCGKGGGSRIKGVVVELHVNINPEWKYRSGSEIEAFCDVKDLWSGMKYRCLLKDIHAMDRASGAIRSGVKVIVETEKC